MEVLRQDFQHLEHRIARLSRHRWVTYGVIALSMASGLVFFLLAFSDTLPGPLRHVITHMADQSGFIGFFEGPLAIAISISALMVGAGIGVAKASPAPIAAGGYKTAHWPLMARP